MMFELHIYLYTTRDKIAFKLKMSIHWKLFPRLTIGKCVCMETEDDQRFVAVIWVEGESVKNLLVLINFCFEQN